MEHQRELQNVILDGENLDMEQFVAVCRGIDDGRGGRRYPQVILSEESRRRLAEVREYIDRCWLSEDAPPVYGFNTGVGPLKDLRISSADNDRFQLNIALSHAADFGDPAPEEVVRGTLLSRINSLAKGVSGIRPEVVDRLVAMLNAGIHPVIPEQGSVGASGDLGPMSHIVIALAGHPDAEVFFRGTRMPAPKAFELAEINPASFGLKGKDSLAIINGCSFSLAFGALALHDAWQALHHANLACAMSMEALRGEKAAFDPRIQQARNQAGQVKAAAEVLRFLQGSEWTTDRGRQVRLPHDRSTGPWKPRVQDAYSLRCAPQVNGAAWDMLEFVQVILEREMNGAIDNPLIFPTADGERFEALSGGNFHGQHLAFATDLLAMAIHEAGSISERRSSRQLDPALNFGLPPNLIGSTVGVNTGFTVTQNGAAALVMENRTLCGATSTDSIPNKSNQEDHVSQATWSGRKARMVVKNVFKIIGIEFLCACQSVSLAEPHMGGLRLAGPTGRVLRRFREEVPVVKEDRFMSPLIEGAIRLVRSGVLLEAAERESGSNGGGDTA